MVCSQSCEHYLSKWRTSFRFVLHHLKKKKATTDRNVKMWVLWVLMASKPQLNLAQSVLMFPSHQLYLLCFWASETDQTLAQGGLGPYHPLCPLELDVFHRSKRQKSRLRRAWSVPVVQNQMEISSRIHPATLGMLKIEVWIIKMSLLSL